MPNSDSDPIVTPPPGDFAVFSNANVVAHVFQWKQPDERVVLSMVPGDFALASKDFTSSKHSTLKVVAGSLTVMLEGKERAVQSGESVGFEMPDLLRLKTGVFTQAVLLPDSGDTAPPSGTGVRGGG